ncbi:microcompartment protein PduM [Citrobacter amalonaticus]|uniref:Microcompartment protein PduM n=1 Tax=Citrobacter amalonaticus TaxID=35703 RepID=A0A2S4S2P5_CITAM|nr:microcompartment protein PduM [Citrobacter amalonaticus]POT59551.1 microcompartment protein PduM [Citrobacter amalonaticus]POT77681.1 microcompartment protein PduM [Citrobacter amalonaticus]POU68133.1 microcompartment protein PduM [Citrobacter amalonaticus]POV07737.1 microcompartment protein PduM [Citrobacter amalonaticus]
MNGELLQRIVGEVVSRLQRRAESTATLSVAQLRETDPRSLFCRYSSLRILQVDLPLLESIARCDSTDTAAAILHEALASGLCIQLSVQRRLLPMLPVKKLARLPLAFFDERGQAIILHPVRLLSYADVARLHEGALVLHRKCVVTALAREAAAARNLQLIKQE